MKGRGRAFVLCSLASVVGLVAVATLVQVLAASAQAITGPFRQPGEISGTVTPSLHLGYGLNVRDPAHLDTLFAPLGFEWVKLYEQYDALPAERLPYKVLYRIQRNGPLEAGELAAWGDHVQAIAQAGRGLVEAYEIGNETNQSWQWGGHVPDPTEYIAALKVAYARIKAVDPSVRVVSGGLGPVGRIAATPAGEGWPGNNGASMDEWEYARAMFTRCTSGCFDVFGYHPFGFAYAPETEPASVSNNFAFRGAEDLRQIMLEYGLDDKPMWATEFGWIRNPDHDGYGWCNLVPDFREVFGWMLVSELEQADYVSRAYAYADTHWPWMEAMFVWNLDWNDQGWDCSDIRFFSLRYVNGDAAPAYDAVAAMDKRPGLVGCRLMAEPAAFDWRICPGGVCQGTTLLFPTLLTGVVHLDGLPACDGITWTATLAPHSTLTPTLPITQGWLGQALTFTLDSGVYLSGSAGSTLIYPHGVYTAALTFTTTPSDVIGNPQTVWITLTVTDEVYALYLPLVARD
jgi:hypothetical protein